jgi:uncharacterized membrane protein YcaP (DUF421 family)
MDLWRIAVRALVAYIYLLFVVRASGKRVVAQATPFDFVVALILGDLIDDALWAEVSMARFAVGAGSLLVVDILVKLGARHSPLVYALVNGRPSVVVRDGEPDPRELRREQLNKADLAHYLRLKGIEDWNEVRLAMLDQDHDLSVLKQPWAEPAQKKDRDRLREKMK